MVINPIKDVVSMTPVGKAPLQPITTSIIDKADIAQDIRTVPKSGNYNLGVYHKLSKEPGLL